MNNNIEEIEGIEEKIIDYFSERDPDVRIESFGPYPMIEGHHKEGYSIVISKEGVEYEDTISLFDGVDRPLEHALQDIYDKLILKIRKSS